MIRQVSKVGTQYCFAVSIVEHRLYVTAVLFCGTEVVFVFYSCLISNSSSSNSHSTGICIFVDRLFCLARCMCPWNAASVLE